MRFFKDNSYDIVRLYINQLGIMIFSMVLYTAVGMIEDPVLNLRIRVLLSVFATCFYLVLIYTAMWEIGAKDKIKIDGGRLEEKKSKGFLMGLIANIPNFVLAGFAVLFVSLYMATDNAGLATAFAIFNLILRFHSAMYLGIIQGVTPSQTVSDLPNYSDYLVESILFLVIPIVSIVTTHLAYTLGSKEKKIFAFLSQNNKKK